LIKWKTVFTPRLSVKALICLFSSTPDKTLFFWVAADGPPFVERTAGVILFFPQTMIACVSQLFQSSMISNSFSFSPRAEETFPSFFSTRKKTDAGQAVLTFPSSSSEVRAQSPPPLSSPPRRISVPPLFSLLSSWRRAKHTEAHSGSSSLFSNSAHGTSPPFPLPKESSLPFFFPRFK